jgi:AraC family carnitine catabolism transcriptional activator
MDEASGREHRQDSPAGLVAGAREPFAALLIITPETSLLGLTCLVDGMRAANRVSGSSLFGWRLASLDGQPVAASNGFPILVDEALLGAVPPPRHVVVFVLASYEQPEALARSLIRYLRAAARQGCTLVGIDQGALLLAAAGLLDGRRATSHWEAVPSLAERFPVVEFAEELFVVDRDRVTCAGHAACLDLVLHLVEVAHGRALAVAAARELVHARPRPGSQPQRCFAPEEARSLSEPVRRALAFMQENLAEPVRSRRVAAAAGLSARQLDTRFRGELRASPMRYYLRLRLALARKLLLYSSMRVSEIACACGFASQANFARTFAKEFRVTPTGYRRNFLASQDRPYVFESFAAG